MSHTEQATARGWGISACMTYLSKKGLGNHQEENISLCALRFKRVLVLLRSTEQFSSIIYGETHGNLQPEKKQKKQKEQLEPNYLHVQITA